MEFRLAALFLLATVFAAASPDLEPRPNEIFPLLIAEPRRAALSASYYRLDGRDAMDLAAGRTWGVKRWRTGEDQDWLWEADFEGLVYSRWNVSGGVNQFETLDLFARAPVTTRRGDVSFKGEFFHENSHLGDDYIRRTGDVGRRLSGEGFRAQAALEPCRFARGYVGSGYLFHDTRSERRWSLQSGVEFNSPDLHWSATHPISVFLAEDLQWRQWVGWNADSRVAAGLRFGLPPSPTRALRVSAGYFTGHSAFGQFYDRREHYADLTVALELGPN